MMPGSSIRPEAYAIVGMGALVAASTHAPITGILLVFEMTNDYALVLPLMLTTVISYLVAHQLEPDSLYSGWLRRRGERIAFGTDQSVLARLRVADAFDRSASVIREGDSVGALLEHLGHADQTVFPVVDANEALVGVITIADLGRVAKDYRGLSPLIIATDLARPSETLSPGETLLDATRRMGVRGVMALPVLAQAANGADDGSRRVLGLLSRSHVLAAYEREAAEGERREHSRVRASAS
jgi:CIC family chloride channel protein